MSVAILASLLAPYRGAIPVNPPIYQPRHRAEVA